MRRGDVVLVAVNGDFGKPRPAIVVQTDAFPQSHGSIIVCPTTSEIIGAADFRITIEPAPENALRVTSQIMVDKPVTVRRERVGQVIGRLAVEQIVQLDAAIAFVMGLAD